MRRTIITVLLILTSIITSEAQTKVPVPPADYGQWEILVTAIGGPSPDGKWLAYGINRSNRNNELRITNIADGTTKVAAFGSQPVFSSDSRYVAYSIGYSEAQEEKLNKEKKPIQRKLGLLNLTTGEQTVVDGIEAFAFSPTGAYLAMRRYPPKKDAAPAEQVTPIKHQKLAYAANWAAYAMDRSIGRPAADLYLIDLATGDRTKIRERLIEDRYVQASPGGRYLLYLQDDHYWTVDTTTRAVVNITKSVQTSFVDRDSDFTIKQKPAFGVAGWAKNDEAVILYDKFDLWQVASDGSRATRLTDGAAAQVRHRYVRLDPDEEWINEDKPAYLSLFGAWTKKSGYARLRLGGEGGASDEHMVWLDKSVQRLAKAKDADVYAYSVEAFDDSPDAFVGGPDLKEAKQVTNRS
jgi:hypothetical protein